MSYQYNEAHEGRWQPMHVGDDAVSRVRARVVWREQNGAINAWAKFRLPDGRVLMVHATTDLAALEQLLTDEAIKKELALRGATMGDAQASGWFKKKFRKLKRAIKKVAKKTGVVKVLKKVHNVVNKVIDNPIVTAALASNPYGAAFLAARKATKMAFKAVKGSLKAKGHIGKLWNLAKKGDLKAKNMLRLVRSQVKLNPKLFSKMKNFQKITTTSGAEIDALAALVQGCVDSAPMAVLGADVPQYHVVAGEHFDIMGEDADGTTDREMDALETLAETGAFEGMRWLAARFGLHSMDAHPDELTARGALLWGRAAQANRFAQRLG